MRQAKLSEFEHLWPASSGGFLCALYIKRHFSAQEKTKPTIQFHIEH